MPTLTLRRVKLVEIANSLEPYMDGRLLVRVTCVSGSAYNLLMLLPPNNSIFVPASEQHISIFTTASRLSDFTSPGWGTFEKH